MTLRDSSIHVLMLSDAETDGGAAIGASRLASGLLAAGARVTRVVGRPDGRVHDWETIPLRSRVRERAVSELLQRVALRFGTLPAVWTQAAYLHAPLRRILRQLRPDVININNVHGSNWLPTIVEECRRHAPTVWTLRDMWSFTGRCSYAYECRKFIGGCDAGCPTTSEYPAMEPRRIAGAWELRRRSLARIPDLVAVSPSVWLATEARAGLWRAHQVDVIPNGLALDTYRPIDRGFAREALGVDARGPVALVCAPDFRERRKGAEILREALSRLGQCIMTLLTMGDGNLHVPSRAISTVQLGYIDHERTKVLAYSAADVFIHAAPVDNLPHVVMEAISCGTPVVALPVGGVPEMVRPGVTGWLAADASVEGMARAIEGAIQDLAAGRDLRRTCRLRAEQEYDLRIQAGRYVDLFASLATRTREVGEAAG